jgi:hypothetical protein
MTAYGDAVSPLKLYRQVLGSLPSTTSADSFRFDITSAAGGQLVGRPSSLPCAGAAAAAVVGVDAAVPPVVVVVLPPVDPLDPELADLHPARATARSRPVMIGRASFIAMRGARILID